MSVRIRSPLGALASASPMDRKGGNMAKPNGDFAQIRNGLWE